MTADTLTIATARSYLLRVPVRPLQVDAQSILESWDVLDVELTTASGLSGWGYQCGFGAAMVALKQFVDGAIFPESSVAMQVNIATGGRSCISSAITRD